MSLLIVILPLLSGFDKVETIKLKITGEVMLDDTGGAEADIDKINALYMKPDLERVLNDNHAMSFYKTGEDWGATSWELYKEEDVNLVENEDETKLIKESVIAWLGVMYEYTDDIIKLEDVDVALTGDEYDKIYEYMQDFQTHVVTYAEDLKHVTKLATKLEREYREAKDYETVNKLVDFMQGGLHKRFMDISRYQFIEDEELPSSITVSSDEELVDNPYAEKKHPMERFSEYLFPVVIFVAVVMLIFTLIMLRAISIDKKRKDIKEETDAKDEESQTK